MAKRYENGTQHFTKVPVKQYSKEGKFIEEYESLSAASRAIGSHASAIQKVIRGERKTAGGYVWRLANDETNE